MWGGGGGTREEDLRMSAWGTEISLENDVLQVYRYRYKLQYVRYAAGKIRSRVESAFTGLNC